MKIRILVVTVIAFSLSLFSVSMYGQGIFSKQNQNDETSEGSHHSKIEQSLLTEDDDWGDGGDDTGGSEAGGGSPVGEGMAILTLLAGGYAMVKSRRNRKEQ